jgi:hypothetical protein
VLPLLATQILWINLITDSGPRWPWAWTRHRRRDGAPPRRPERPGDRRRACGPASCQIGLVMALATLLTLDILLPGGLIEGDQDLDTARTAAFTVLVLQRSCSMPSTPAPTRERVPRAVRQPLAVGFASWDLVWRCRWPWWTAGSEPRLRHGAAGLGSVAALRRDGSSAVMWFSELRKH